MATYTVTREVTRPNTSTQWPDEYISTDGYVNLVSSGKVNLTQGGVSSDGLVQTCIFVWASKTDYTNNQSSADNPDSTWLAARNSYTTYMAENNITARITEEDGTVRDFNSSSRTLEEE